MEDGRGKKPSLLRTFLSPPKASEAAASHTSEEEEKKVDTATTSEPSSSPRLAAGGWAHVNRVPSADICCEEEVKKSPGTRKRLKNKVKKAKRLKVPQSARMASATSPGVPRKSYAVEATNFIVVYKFDGNSTTVVFQSDSNVTCGQFTVMAASKLRIPPSPDYVLYARNTACPGHSETLFTVQDPDACFSSTVVRHKDIIHSEYVVKKVSQPIAMPIELFADTAAYVEIAQKAASAFGQRPRRLLAPEGQRRAAPRRGSSESMSPKSPKVVVRNRSMTVAIQSAIQQQQITNVLEREAQEEARIQLAVTAASEEASKKKRSSDKKERKERKLRKARKKAAAMVEADLQRYQLEAEHQILHPMRSRSPVSSPSSSPREKSSSLSASQHISLSSSKPLGRPVNKRLLAQDLRSTLVRTQSDTMVSRQQVKGSSGKAQGKEGQPLSAIADFRSSKVEECQEETRRAAVRRSSSKTSASGSGLLLARRQETEELVAEKETEVRPRSASEPFLHSWDYHIVNYLEVAELAEDGSEVVLTSALRKNTIMIPRFPATSGRAALRGSIALSRNFTPWPADKWKELPAASFDKLGDPPQIWPIRGHPLHMVEFLSNLKCHRDFRTTFMLTLQYHTPSEEMFAILAGRVAYLHEKSVERKAALAAEGKEQEKVYDKFMVGIKQILSFVDAWTRNTYVDFYESKGLVSQLKGLVNFLEDEVYNGAALVQKLQLQPQSSNPDLFSMQSAPMPFMPIPRFLTPTGYKNLSLLDIHPLELARQITLSDFSHLSLLREPDLFNARWQKPGAAALAPNTVAYTRWFNHLTYCFVTEILTALNDGRRAEFIERAIAVCKALFDMQNFNGTMAVLSALNMRVVDRLAGTWSFISKKSRKQLAHIAEVMSSRKNFSVYRDYVKTLTLPMIPFQALVCGDVAKAALAMDTRFEDGAVNFLKMIELAKIVQPVLLSQQMPYCFYRVPAIESFLMEMKPIEDEDELYKLSYAIEKYSGT